MYTIECYAALKEENPVTCYNIGESQGPCAEWNKPVTKR